MKGRVEYTNIFLFNIKQLFSFYLLWSCFFPCSPCCCCCTQCSEHVSPTAAITLKQHYLSQFSLLTRRRLWVDGTRLIAWSSLIPDKESWTLLLLSQACKQCNNIKYIVSLYFLLHGNHCAPTVPLLFKQNWNIKMKTAVSLATFVLLFAAVRCVSPEKWVITHTITFNKKKHFLRLSACIFVCVVFTEARI